MQSTSHNAVYHQPLNNPTFFYFSVAFEARGGRSSGSRGSFRGGVRRSSSTRSSSPSRYSGSGYRAALVAGVVAVGYSRYRVRYRNKGHYYNDGKSNLQSLTSIPSKTQTINISIHSLRLPILYACYEATN